MDGVPPEATLHQIVCLHRYWITADRMRLHYEHYLRSPDAQAIITAADPLSVDAKRFQMEVRVYMDPWYAQLYVVIEGWRRLRLRDSEVGRLLRAKAFVDLLREYRNASFHYTEEYYDDRFTAVWSRTTMGAWALETHAALGRALLESQRAHPERRGSESSGQ